MQRLIVFSSIVVMTGTVDATVTVFTNRQQWQDAAGAHTTIDFTDLPNFTVVTDQYSTQGVLFTDGSDFVHVSNAYSDDHGLVSSDPPGELGRIHLAFTEDRSSLAFDFIGALVIELYNDGQMIYFSDLYVAGFTPFVGLVSSMPFDAAVEFDDGVVAVDNIHFGTIIPATNTMLVLLIGVASSRPRRVR